MISHVTSSQRSRRRRTFTRRVFWQRSGSAPGSEGRGGTRRAHACVAHERQAAAGSPIREYSSRARARRRSPRRTCACAARPRSTRPPGTMTHTRRSRTGSGRAVDRLVALQQRERPPPRRLRPRSAEVLVDLCRARSSRRSARRRRVARAPSGRRPARRCRPASRRGACRSAGRPCSVFIATTPTPSAFAFASTRGRSGWTATKSKPRDAASGRRPDPGRSCRRRARRRRASWSRA